MSNGLVVGWEDEERCSKDVRELLETWRGPRPRGFKYLKTIGLNMN